MAFAHMCWMRAFFVAYETTTGRGVKMGNKGSAAAAGVGTLVLTVIVHGKTTKNKMEKVLLVLTMGYNLMSDGMVEESGAEMSFKGGQAILRTAKNVAACATRKNGLYQLDQDPMSNAAAVASLQLWHERLGHVDVADVRRMITHKDIDGLNCSSMAVKDVCEPCVYRKAAMASITRAAGSQGTKRLQLVHSNLGGPMSELSCSGALYFGTFTDHVSGWKSVLFSQRKNDLLAEYKKWLKKAQLHSGTKTKVLCSDNGSESVTTAIKAFHGEKATTHQTTVPDTP